MTKQLDIFTPCEGCGTPINKNATLNRLLEVHDVDRDLLPSDKEVIQESANRQRSIALAYFRANPNSYLSSEDIHAEIVKAYPKTPIVSSRRAVTNLKTEKKIEKLKGKEFKKMGSNGVMICTYKLI